MAWIAAGAALLGGLGKSQQDDQNNQMSQDTSFGTQELKNTGELENTQLAAQEAYYYSQLNKQEKQRGLDEFRKFSTVKDFAPSYVNTNPNPINVPSAPVIPQQTAPTGLPQGSGGSNNGLLGGLLGGALIGDKLLGGSL